MIDQMEKVSKGNKLWAIGRLGLKGALLSFLLSNLLTPLPCDGIIRISLTLEKKQYLLDEALFAEVELKGLGNGPSYYQRSSSLPALEVRDSNNRLMPTMEVHGDAQYPIQRFAGKGGRSYLQAEKIKRGEVVFVISDPIYLKRSKFNVGRYKASFPILEYKDAKGNFDYSYSNPFEFEIVEPKEEEVHVDSVLCAVFRLIEQIQYTKAWMCLDSVLAKYPNSTYAGTVMSHLINLMPWDRSEKATLDFLDHHHDSFASNYGVLMLTLHWFAPHDERLDRVNDYRKRIEGLAVKYKGTPIEQTIRRQIAMLEKRRNDGLKNQGQKH